jgi:hypothetical protein
MLLAIAMSLMVACSGPTTPSDTLPPSARPITAYVAVDSPSYGARYVLYDDSTFTLRYSRSGPRTFEYQGRYTRAGQQIVFNFGFFSPAGPWQAIGVLTDGQGSEMAVAYNELMKWLEFVNGRYVRTSAPG